MNSTSGRHGFHKAFVRTLIAASCVALVLLFNGCKLEPKRVDTIDMPSFESIEMGEVEHVESGFAALLTEQDDESGANDSEPGTNSTGNQPEDDSWKNDKPRDGESCAIYAQRVQPKLKEAGGDGGAYNYIENHKERIVEIPENANLEEIIHERDVIVWDKGHSETTGANDQWGHVAVVLDVSPDGVVVVHHANWKPPEKEFSREYLRKAGVYVISFAD